MVLVGFVRFDVFVVFVEVGGVVVFDVVVVVLYLRGWVVCLYLVILKFYDLCVVFV